MRLDNKLIYATEIPLKTGYIMSDLEKAKFNQFDSEHDKYLKTTREELGSVAEHIIRASAIAALSGALGKMAIELWPKAPKIADISSIQEYYQYFSALSLFISSPILGIFSGMMMVSLLLHIETLVNVKRYSIIFWLFLPLCFISLFSIFGAAISFLDSINKP